MPCSESLVFRDPSPGDASEQRRSAGCWLRRNNESVYNANLPSHRESRARLNTTRFNGELWGERRACFS